MSHHPLILEIGISLLTHIRSELRGQARAVLSWSPLRISADPPGWAVGTHGREDDTESVVDLDPVIPVETVEKGTTGPATVEPPRNTEIHRRHLEP